MFEKLNIEKIDAVVAANNVNVLEGKTLFDVDIKDIHSGEILYTRHFVGEKWDILLIRGKTSTYYQLHKTIVNKQGKSIDIKINLSDDEIEYLKFYKSDSLLDLFRTGKQNVILKTRFMYGCTDAGYFYVGVFVNMADDKIRKSEMLSNLKSEIILDSMQDEKTAFTVFFEKKLDKEIAELNEEDIL